MAVYAAFLRGVNVNGVTIKMEALREVHATSGFTGVKTVLEALSSAFGTKALGTMRYRGTVTREIPTLCKRFSRRCRRQSRNLS